MTVIEAARPWPTTTGSGKLRSAGKSNSGLLPGPVSAAANAWCTGIQRVNMVSPSETMQARTASAAQPMAPESVSR